jgi:mannose-1-phosphate guanylyltransferase
VRAIALVGGEGTRLRPLTYTTPKQLLPVVEVPMVERVLANLAASGVDEVVLSMAYRPDAFRAAYPEGSAAGVQLTYAIEPEPLDTAGAIRFAALEAAIDETFVVVNGDVLTDIDVAALVGFHRARGADATIQLTCVDDPSRYGVVPTDADGRVVAFVEKPRRGEIPSNQVNAGTYVLEPSVLERIAPGRRVSVERDTFPALAAEGRVYASASPAYWLDTGTPEAYLRANTDLLDGTRPGPPAPGARQGGAGVWTLGRPELRGDVGPSSLVGDGAVVEAGAVVRASVVGSGCVIEPGAVVSDSVLLPGCRVAAGASVSRSILGRRVVVGAAGVVGSLSVVGDDVEIRGGDTLAGARVPAEV